MNDAEILKKRISEMLFEITNIRYLKALYGFTLGLYEHSAKAKESED